MGNDAWLAGWLWLNILLSEYIPARQLRTTAYVGMYLCSVYDQPSQLGRAEFGRRLPAPDACLHALVARHLPHQRTILH